MASMIHAPGGSSRGPPGPHMQLTPLQVPLMHVLPAQHGSPVMPHDWHVPPEQTTSLPVQMLPGQHASPKLPQMAQVFVDVWHASMNPVLALQLPPGQQVSPSPPHVWQVLVASQ